ncbi:YL1 nuclear protein-domain-containing protein [Protomyces lactucae-debilis]|uniref:YL1 nuclear protein-domain-containing protein n=1 Tax=Protomyces lactucae-debilis TaxID=2754530 RepID=A0A1Y2FIZ0_PROLT|nr:YL1 nuclear protein-domain-containing protein [Protomyces lactucae-debilis]ORY83899.1 YL1 nuclear protein-domain-containing protein [Protomyces lactucae-debilis]
MSSKDFDGAASGSGSDGGYESESSFQMPDPLALGREKRATAGNRLRDMLNLEIETEGMFAEDAEDDDFGSDQDQVDDHNSELDSSSEEDAAQQEPEDAGEQALKTQEKAANRQKKRRAAEAFTKAKPKVKQIPVAANTATPQLPKKRDRASLNTSAQRQSARAHTRQVAGAVEQRLKAAKSRQSQQVVAPRVVERPLTQAERLEEAKRTEEINVASLNQVVQYEEEKKATQRALAAKRQAAQPTIRIFSTTKASTHPTTKVVPKIIDVSTTETSLAHPMDAVAQAKVAPELTTVSTIDPAPRAKEASPTPAPAAKHFVAFAHFESAPFARELLLGLPPGTKRKRPPAKVLCPITGRLARYKDPSTRVCVANLEAYRVVKQLANGEVLYNPTLEMYTAPAYVPSKR